MKRIKRAMIPAPPPKAERKPAKWFVYSPVVFKGEDWLFTKEVAPFPVSPFVGMKVGNIDGYWEEYIVAAVGYRAQDRRVEIEFEPDEWADCNEDNPKDNYEADGWEQIFGPEDREILQKEEGEDDDGG